MKKTMTKYVRILSFFILSIFLLTKDTTASPISKSFLKSMFEDAYFSIPAITYISSDNYNLGTNEKTINFFGLDFEIPESERAQKKEFWYSNPTVGVKRKSDFGYLDISYSQSISSEFGKLGGITTLDWFDNRRFFKRLAFGVSDNPGDKNSFVSSNFDFKDIVYGVTVGIDHLDTWELNTSFRLGRASRLRLAYFDDNFMRPYYRSFSSQLFIPIYRSKNFSQRWTPKVDGNVKIIRRIYDKKPDFRRDDWEGLFTVNVRLSRFSIFLQLQDINTSDDFFSRQQTKLGLSLAF